MFRNKPVLVETPEQERDVLKAEIVEALRQSSLDRAELRKIKQDILDL